MDYKDINGNYWANIASNKLEIFFTVVFTVEAAIKIVGLGLVMGHKTYLRDTWNWIDLFVVVTSLL
jgi:hypothetical protein